MNRAFDVRGFAEALNYLSETERHAAQHYYDDQLNGGAQQSPPRARLFPRFIRFR